MTWLIMPLACMEPPEVELVRTGGAQPNCRLDEDCCRDLHYWSGSPDDEFRDVIDGTTTVEESFYEAAMAHDLVLFAYLSECNVSNTMAIQEAEWLDRSGSVRLNIEIAPMTRPQSYPATTGHGFWQEQTTSASRRWKRSSHGPRTTDAAMHSDQASS